MRRLVTGRCWSPGLGVCIGRLTPSEAVYVTRGTLTMMVLAGKAATGLSPVSKWD